MAFWKATIHKYFCKNFPNNTHEGVLKLKTESKIFTSAEKDSPKLLVQLFFNTLKTDCYYFSFLSFTVFLTLGL